MSRDGDFCAISATEATWLGRKFINMDIKETGEVSFKRFSRALKDDTKLAKLLSRGNLIQLILLSSKFNIFRIHLCLCVSSLMDNLCDPVFDF